MYVETDFLTALVKDDDWLQESALDALVEYDDIHTSILSYAEVPVLFYDHIEAEYKINAPRAITNLLELVPIVPEIHEDAILAAATYLDEYHMTPFDALHAGLVAPKGQQVLSTELDYDTVGLDRVPLAPSKENG